MSDDFLDPRLAERLTRAARAAQTLSETLWEALHEELAAPRSERVAELSERLADLSAIVASLARVDTSPPSSAEPLPAGDPGRATQDAPEPTVAPVESGSSGERATHARQPIEHSPLSREPPLTQAPLSVAVLVDELAPEGSSEIEISDVRDKRGGPAGRRGSDGRRPSDYGYTRS